MKDITKRKILMADKSSAMDAAAKKLVAVRTEVVNLQADVAAVIKAKSGFFARSKSLPQLKALSTALTKFADDLQAARHRGLLGHCT